MPSTGAHCRLPALLLSPGITSPLESCGSWAPVTQWPRSFRKGRSRACQAQEQETPRTVGTLGPPSSPGWGGTFLSGSCGGVNTDFQ